MLTRGFSSRVIVSAPSRSQSFVVFGDACPAICWACSSVPPFARYAVIPVARNVWQQVEGGSPAADARRLIMAGTHPPGRRPARSNLSRARATLWAVWRSARHRFAPGVSHAGPAASPSRCRLCSSASPLLRLGS